MNKIRAEFMDWFPLSPAKWHSIGRRWNARIAVEWHKHLGLWKRDFTLYLFWFLLIRASVWFPSERWLVFAVVWQLEIRTCHISDTSIKKLSSCFTLCLHFYAWGKSSCFHRWNMPQYPRRCKPLTNAPVCPGLEVFGVQFGWCQQGFLKEQEM